MKLINENTEVESSLDNLGEEAVVIAPKKGKGKKKIEPVTEEPKTDLDGDDSDETIEDFTALIVEWKSTYKRIFKNEVDGELIIWRRLKRGEYKNILNLKVEDEDSKVMIKQELMVEAAVLYPSNIKTLIEENAGLATVLSEEILAKSGFAISYTEEI